MAEVSVYEAKTHLSRLLLRVAAGEDIVIAKSGKPVARLVPYSSKKRRVFGGDEGLFQIPDDFDETPDDLVALFEGDDAVS